MTESKRRAGIPPCPRRRGCAPCSLDTLACLHYNNGMYSGHAPVSLPASRSRPGPSTQPLVRIEALCKQFGHAVVLDHIDLDVHAGEKITLIGPSGAGKSTLLRCVNYLERPTSGHVYLDGE